MNRIRICCWLTLCLFLLLLLFSHISTAQIYNSFYKKNLSDFTEFTWDSVAYQWHKKIKLSFVYNIDETLTGETLKTWNDDLRKWIPSAQNIFKYDLQKRISEKFNKFRSAKSGKVISSQKTKYIYRKNKLTEEQIFDISKKDQWLITSMARYEYDTVGRQISKVVSKYKKKSFFTCATEYSLYDSLGNQIKKAWENGCTGTDVVSGENTMEYDTIKRILSELFITDNGEKILRKYKYKDAKIQRIHLQNWDKKDSLWRDNFIEFYLYNQHDNVIEKLQQVRSGDNTKWINGRKTIYGYNADNKIFVEIEQKWDALNFNWLNVFKREYIWVAKKK